METPAYSVRPLAVDTELQKDLAVASPPRPRFPKFKILVALGLAVLLAVGGAVLYLSLRASGPAEGGRVPKDGDSVHFRMNLENGNQTLPPLSLLSLRVLAEKVAGHKALTIGIVAAVLAVIVAAIVVAVVLSKKPPNVPPPKEDPVAEDIFGAVPLYAYIVVAVGLVAAVTAAGIFVCRFGCCGNKSAKPSTPPPHVPNRNAYLGSCYTVLATLKEQNYNMNSASRLIALEVFIRPGGSIGIPKMAAGNDIALSLPYLVSIRDGNSEPANYPAWSMIDPDAYPEHRDLIVEIFHKRMYAAVDEVVSIINGLKRDPPGPGDTEITYFDGTGQHTAFIDSTNLFKGIYSIHSGPSLWFPLYYTMEDLSPTKEEYIQARFMVQDIDETHLNSDNFFSMADWFGYFFKVLDFHQRYINFDD